MTDQNQGQNWAAGLTDDTATKAAPQAQTAPQQAAPQAAPGSDWAAGLTDQTATHAMTAVEKSNAAVDRMQKEAPPMAENGGLTWEGVKAAPGRLARGLGQVAKFAGDVKKDISNPNKPLFFSKEGAEPGSVGESDVYKYLFAPQVEQFNQAQEMARQANEEYRKGNDVAGRRNQLEAWGHWGASVIPMVGPWLGGQAEQAGKTGDILGTTAETVGQAVGGELLHKGVEIGIDRTTRVAGAIAEGTALKSGASPEVARTVGNIASLGTKNISIDAHVDALDKAVDNHIDAKDTFESAQGAVDTAKAAVDANPEDVNAQAGLKTAQKALDKASSAYDKAGEAVDKIQDKILSELSPYDWSKLSPAHIVDIAQSAIGITDDFDTAVTRFANMAGKQAGQAFKSALSSVREDLKEIINSDTEGKIVDPKTAADAIDAHTYQNIESPLQQASGETRGSNNPVVENFRPRVEARIDKFFEDNPGEAGSIDQEQKIKQQILDRVMRGQDLGDGVTAPREPNLYEAESIRRGLKQYEPNETKGYNKVAYDIANFMREVIDEGYSKRGVDAVKEARAKEAKLITISEGLRKAQPLFETQEGTPIIRKVIKASGAVLLASTLGAALLHNPLGALTGLGELWAKLYDSNAKDIAGNLDRARELAGRSPEATATTPEVGTRPPEPPAPEITQRPSDVPPNMPPPPPPPIPAVRPEINHTLAGELAAHFPDVTEEPTTADAYDALMKRFMDDYQTKLDGVKDFQSQNPGKPLPDGVKEEWDAATELKGKIVRERAKENAEIAKENQKRQTKYQSDLAKYNAKYQAEVAKATAKAKADAEAAAKKAETDAAAKSDALKNDPRIIHGAGGLMPATEPVRAIVGAGDHTSEQAHGHEGGGHTIAYASQGLDPFEFISDTHPKAIEKDAAAAIRTRIDAAAPGAEGVFQRVIGMLGGPAWDEVHSGIDPADNRAGRDDFNQAKKALREEAGLTPSEVDTVMEELYNTAKEVVSKPEAVALAKANIAVREVGLPDTHHMSETRMTDYVKALKGVFGNGETKTPTTDGRVSGEADESAPERESDLGGSKTEKPSGNTEKVPAGKVRASEGESEEGARGSGPGVEQANLRRTLETAREKKFKVSGTDEHGNPIDEEIYAHSFNKARKMAEAKHEGARQLAVDVTGESEPYGEYQLPKKKPMTTPNSRMEPDKESAEKSIRDTMIHELGHYMVGHNEGHTSKGMLRESHPDMPRGANAAISWDGSSIFDNGRISDEKLPGVLRTLAGGVAADEVFSNLPRDLNANFFAGGIADGAKMRQFLRAAGYPESGIYERVNRAVDEAKEHLTKPHVRGVIEENIGTREPKLSSQYHFSPERLKSMGDEAARRGAQNGSGTEGSDNGTTGRPSNQTGGGNVGGGEGGAAPAVGEEAVTEPKSILDTAREQEHGVEQSNLSKAKAKDVLDKIVGKYGTSDNVEALRHDHSFILPDGKLVHLEGTQHGDAIADHGGGNSNEKNGWDNRPEFINKSGAVRAQGYQDRAGDSLSFSVPKDGVTREQADTMNRAASQPYMRNGNLKVERADIKAETANELYRQKDFPRVGDIHEMLRQIGAHPDQVEQSNLEKTPSQVEEHEKNGGSTFTPEGRNLAGADTHAVAAYPERGQTVDQLTSENLAAFKQKNADVLAGGQHAVGTWKDPETGKTALDIVKTVADRDEAVKAGQDANQKAIYHLKTGETIPTGGTGEVPKVEQSNLNEDEGFNFGKNAEGTEDQQKGLISARQPSGKNATEDPLKQDLTIGKNEILNAPGTTKGKTLAERAADKIRQIPGIKIPKNVVKPEAVINHFIKQLSDNLVAMHDRIDPAKREANAKWYESANGLAAKLGEQYGKGIKQMAGLIAAMSPQKDWDMNVGLARRVADIYHTKNDIKMTPEMEAKAEALTTELEKKQGDEEGETQYKNAAMKGLLENLKGKSLSELTDPIEKAAWVRLYDEAHNDRSYQKIDPGTGNDMGAVQGAKGPSKIAWGSLNQIANGISILEDGSRENISNHLGDSHKVRNFYNNILDPNNPAGHVTIDTHAVAASLWRALSGKSGEVLDNFGRIGSKTTGAKGLYGLYADAYRDAASRLGLQPRQLQSIVWEEVRNMFPEPLKGAKDKATGNFTHVDAIDNIWKDYQAGKITKPVAQQQISDYAQNVRDTFEKNRKPAKGKGFSQSTFEGFTLPSKFVNSNSPIGEQPR